MAQGLNLKLLWSDFIKFWANLFTSNNAVSLSDVKISVVLYPKHYNFLLKNCEEVLPSNYHRCISIGNIIKNLSHCQFVRSFVRHSVRQLLRYKFALNLCFYETVALVGNPSSLGLVVHSTSVLVEDRCWQRTNDGHFCFARAIAICSAIVFGHYNDKSAKWIYKNQSLGGKEPTFSHFYPHNNVISHTPVRTGTVNMTKIAV